MTRAESTARIRASDTQSAGSQRERKPMTLLILQSKRSSARCVASTGRSWRANGDQSRRRFLDRAWRTLLGERIGTLSVSRVREILDGIELLLEPRDPE